MLISHIVTSWLWRVTIRWVAIPCRRLDLLKPVGSLVLIFFVLSVSGQQAQIDSLDQLFDTEQLDSNRLKYTSQLAELAADIDLELALKYTQRGIELSNELNEQTWQPVFFEKHGRTHANMLHLDSAMHYFEKALAGYEEVENERGQATTAFKIAWVHKREGNIDEAMESDLLGLRLMEALDDKAGIASALGRVSEDLMLQGRQAEALEYAQQSIAICEAHGLDHALFYANRSAGDACIAAGKNKEALAYYNQSLALAKTLRLDNFSLADIINCRGNANKRLGYYELALIDYEQCLAYAEEVNYKNAISTAIANLGEVNLLLGHFEVALPYQLQTIELQESSGNLTNLPENYQHASTIYSELGDYKSAWSFERKSRELREATMSEASDERISKLRTQYETEKKEATILAQKQQLYNQNLTLWLSIGIALLLAAFLFFLFLSYRSRTKANKLLAIKNAENELLLKEVHHRVKNNLEVVSSLLLLQSSQIEDEKVKEAMREGQNRVQSIGLLHQKLYQGHNLGAIDMRSYFINLSESILDTFGAEDRVTIQCAMDELSMDIDNAVPLGLIVNELLTNTMKYAFPDGRKGQVRIQLSQAEENTWHLEVADDGIGKIGVTKGSGFGSQLVDLLTRQLNGTMREELGNGTRFLFDFKLNAPHA